MVSGWTADPPRRPTTTSKEGHNVQIAPIIGDGLVSGATGGAVVGMLVLAATRLWVTRLVQRVDYLEEHRVGTIEGRVMILERKEARADTTAATVDAIKTTVVRIEGKVDGFTADIARLQQAQENTHEYLTHVDAELSEHLGKAGGRRHG
jgi:hypothetical protein